MTYLFREDQPLEPSCSVSNTIKDQKRRKHLT